MYAYYKSDLNGEIVLSNAQKRHLNELAKETGWTYAKLALDFG